MKKNLLKIAAATLLALGAMGVQAETTVDQSVAVSGSFVGVCNVTSNTFALGTIDLSTKLVYPGTRYTHVRVPLTLDVQCNSQSLPWSVTNASNSYAPLTIGSTSTNTACLSIAALAETSPNTSRTVPYCADYAGTGDRQPITGVGTASVGVSLAIWDDVYANTTALIPTTGFKGSGAISAVVPLKITF